MEYQPVVLSSSGKKTDGDIRGSAASEVGRIESSGTTTTTAKDFKYRAFISYSHSDRNWAEWLHRRLENYHVDQALVAHRGKWGRVPNRLRPIFLDREGISCSFSLSDRINEALADSSALIVICSPAAAKSDYVNAEIRRFKKCGRSERIFCFIVAGEPNDPDRNCLPKALLTQFDADNQPIGCDEQPIAADARRSGDGRKRALARLIAGVLGVPFQAIWQGERRADLRRTTMASLTYLSALMIIIAAGALYVQHEIGRDKRSATALQHAASLLGEANRMTTQHGAQTAVVLSFLTEAERRLDEVEDNAVTRPHRLMRQAEINLRYASLYHAQRKNADQIARAEKAVQTLKALLALEQTPDGDNRLAIVEAWRRARGLADEEQDGITRWLCRLLGVTRSKPPEADTLLMKAHRALGAAYLAGNFDGKALAEFEAGLSRSITAGEQGTSAPIERIAVDMMTVGDIQLEIARVHHMRGGYDLALAHAREAIKLLTKLEMDIKGPSDRFALVRAYYTAADVQRTVIEKQHKDRIRREHFNEAESTIEKAARIAVGLHNNQRNDTARAQFLARIRIVQGDIYKRRGDYALALKSYEDSRDLLIRLQTIDPGNAGVKADLAFSHVKIGETQRDWALFGGNGDLQPAIKSYELSIAMYEELRRKDQPPTRGMWFALADHAMTLKRLGDHARLSKALMHQLEVARMRYDKSSSRDGTTRMDFARSLADLADSLRVGSPDEALKLYEEALAVTDLTEKELASSPPHLEHLLRRRVRALLGYSRVRLDQGAPEAAIARLNEALNVADKVPSETDRYFDLLGLVAEVNWTLSEAQARLNNSATVAACRDALRHLDMQLSTDISPDTRPEMDAARKQAAKRRPEWAAACEAREKTFASTTPYCSMPRSHSPACN